MNPDLDKLLPYPFERLLQLKQGAQPPMDLPHIALSIGEPKHQPPQFALQQLASHLHTLGGYPLTKGTDELRQTIAQWLCRRFALDSSSIDAQTQVIPVNGTREALFAFAQAVVDRSRDPVVLMPNPFYQIYEGAVFLAGATPVYLNTTAQTQFIPDFTAVPEKVWQHCQLVYICTPGNPTGAVMQEQQLQQLIELADRYDFIIASDECYSEIYFDEQQPPPGLLQVAHAMGRTDYKRCVVMHSLSKRSNVPGLRSGFVAGDAEIMQKFLQYRTYHGCAMPLFAQSASIALWNDEHHVAENRQLYREKFAQVMDVLQPVINVELPQAGFYLWPETPLDDEIFTRRLFDQQNVTVLPGSYLSREADGINPGKNRVRIALVASLEECLDAACRIKEFIEHL
ncbi:MAG: succinyldiaminopimelate transaminase [Gammaproteobacteria bacterium]|jgi:N-succinyldiaminopimelate aminotransferase|nr:succinyldiaminopimelate transaminase [Gammaproteobacteria bacterium]